jgi:hypothetical protein
LRRESGPVFVVIRILVAGSAASPDFLTGSNLFNLGLSAGKIAIMTLISNSGEIDLSVASIVGMASALLGRPRPRAAAETRIGLRHGHSPWRWPVRQTGVLRCPSRLRIQRGPGGASGDIQGLLRYLRADGEALPLGEVAQLVARAARLAGFDDLAQAAAAVVEGGDSSGWPVCTPWRA